MTGERKFKARPITKSVFLAALECLAKGRFVYDTPADGAPPTETELFRMEEGWGVHRRARALHPEGIFAGTPAKTSTAMGERSNRVIFEAAFESGGFAARADWIRRARGGWIVGEIKSSLHNDDGPSDEQIDDLAYTVMVLSAAGVQVTGAELVLLNRDWRLGNSDAELFVVGHCLDAVMPRVEQMRSRSEEIEKAILGRRPPNARACWACRNCEYFAQSCVGVGVEDPVFNLPRLQESRFDQLRDLGILSIRDIPEGFPLSDHQLAVVDVTISGKPRVVRDEIEAGLAAVRYPVGYLDFETMKTAIPLYPGVAPHEQVVTQYSLHRRRSPEADLEHAEYLADSSRDCRRELAERLLADTADCETVFMYSPFERRVIRELAERFGDLEGDLRSLDRKLLDLEPIVRRGLIHPAFKGRTSIKVVLPVIAPDLRYDDLEIGDGGAAMVEFVKIAKSPVSLRRRAVTRRSLLRYCAMDTHALIEVHQALVI